MYGNVSEVKDGLKIEVTVPAWCSFHTMQKLQFFFKSCSRMSEKAKKS